MNGPDALPDRIDAVCKTIFGDTSPPLLVAVSGGPDSAALAHLLARIDRYPLRLAHLNHRLRSDEEQLQERQAVERLATMLSLPLVSEDLEPDAIESAMRRSGTGPEATARTERYRFLVRTALEYEAALVTAHHRDDQAETVLLQLMSGRSITGNALGIAMDGTMPGEDGRACRIVRPALAVERADLRRWCDAQDLPFVIDSSNRDTRFRRNRLRLEVMPVLEAFYHDASGALARFSREVTDLKAAVDALLPPGLVEERGPDTIVLDRDIYTGLPRAARALVLRRVIQRVSRRNRVDTTSLEGFIDNTERSMAADTFRLADVEIAIDPGEIRVRPVVRDVETGYLLTVRGASILEFRSGYVRAIDASTRLSESGAVIIGPIIAPLVVRSFHPGDRVMRDGRARSIRDLTGEGMTGQTCGCPPAILEDRRGIIGIVRQKTIEVLRDGVDLLDSDAERPGYSPPLYLECEDDSLYAK